MTVLSERPSTDRPAAASPADAAMLGRDLLDTVTMLIREATNGPERSGVSAAISIGGARIDVSASRGWGVQFTRALPGGRVERCHLAGDELTIERATAACLELSRIC